MNAEIKKYNGEKQRINFSERVQIAQRQNTDTVYDFYLKKRGDDYIINVLGLNGEPVPRVPVTGAVTYKWIDNHRLNFQLESDSNG